MMSSSLYNWPMHQRHRPLQPSTYSDPGSRTVTGYPSPARSDAHRDSIPLSSSNMQLPSQLCEYKRVLDDAQAAWSVCYPSLHAMPSPSSQAYSGLAIRFKAQTPEETEPSWSTSDVPLHVPRFAPATISPHALHDGAALDYSPMNSSISSRSHGSPETPNFDDDMNTLYTPEPLSRDESARIANAGTWASPFAVSIQDEPCHYALTPDSDVDTLQCDAVRDALMVKQEPECESSHVNVFPELDMEYFDEYKRNTKVFDEGYSHLHDQIDGRGACMDDESMKETDDIKRTGHRSRFACPLCEKTFDRLYNYKQHLHTHDTHRKRPFACTVPDCCQSFYRQTDLKRHHDSKHTRSRAYRCEKCQVGFPRKDSLMRHRQASCITRVRKNERGLRTESPVKLEEVEQEDSERVPARRLLRANGNGRGSAVPKKEEEDSYYVSPTIRGTRATRR